jgi:hypothetical protein
VSRLNTQIICRNVLKLPLGRLTLRRRQYGPREGAEIGHQPDDALPSCVSFPTDLISGR